MTNKATKAKRVTPATNWSPLVGRWFHAYDGDGALKAHGQVLAAVTPEVFLVQRYEWTGGLSDQIVVPLAQMMAWAFYDSEVEMHRMALVNTDQFARDDGARTCLFCGGERAAPDHLRTCDGRQGRVEADEV
jgi:hypothetical protein